MLVETLQNHGFTRVLTPILMSRALLEKMSIHEEHPLHKQIFWVDKSRCLRPMLAPHLYSLLQDLGRLWKRPIRIFEIGTCFRKETRGSRHSAEFTMLNLVELGLSQHRCLQRIEQLSTLVTGAANINDFWLEEQQSAVYGQTIDILTGSRQNGKKQIELGSGATGPHPLDRNWQIKEPWAGIGFGLERLLMAAESSDSLGHWGRSLSYLDGISLRI
jgi:phenylalanyl-tRNA synthetase alpha chain